MYNNASLHGTKHKHRLFSRFGSFYCLPSGSAKCIDHGKLSFYFLTWSSVPLAVIISICFPWVNTWWIQHLCRYGKSNGKKNINNSLASTSKFIHGVLAANMNCFFTVCLKLSHNPCQCINKDFVAYLCKLFSLSKDILYANVRRVHLYFCSQIKFFFHTQRLNNL